jgi:short-subunit dehydrogenase
MALLTGKVIVITGASSGVGRAMANALAEQGAILILAARDEEALEEAAKECRELGGVSYAIPTDTRNAAEVEHLAMTATALTGELFAWINNAGVMAIGALDQVPAEINEEVIRTNLLGYINGAQVAIPIFKRQRHGIIINNISVGGWLPTPYATAYSASKFGLRGFSEALKGEIKHFPGISIVDLYPSFLDTPGLQHAANYTGKVIKPLPPLIDPRTVAKAVVQLLINPRPRKTIGYPTLALRLTYSLFPACTRNLTGYIIRAYLKQAPDIEMTSGSVLAPVAFGTSIDGGWRKEMKPSAKVAGLGLAALAGIGALILTINRKK